MPEGVGPESSSVAAWSATVLTLVECCLQYYDVYIEVEPKRMELAAGKLLSLNIAAQLDMA